MEIAFLENVASRAEARRWFAAAERMLRERDYLGCRSCAIRARDIDPKMSRAVDEIIVVATTLQAGERRTVSNQPDWYAILGLTASQGCVREVVASRFHNLVYILNPQRNRFPFADRAVGMVYDAWSVLSDPARKSMYDRGLGLYLTPPPPPPPQLNLVNDPILAMQYNFRLYGQPPPPPPLLHGGASIIFGLGQHAPLHVPPVVRGPTRIPQPIVGSNANFNFLPRFGSRPEMESLSWSEMVNFLKQEGSSTSASGENMEQLYGLQNQNQNHSTVGEESPNDEDKGAVIDVERAEEGKKEAEEKKTFWTVCPYCYYVFEYLDSYANRAMLCQNCRKTFHAVEIESPPAPVNGQEAYYACWGSFPFGQSIEAWNNRDVVGPSNAAPQVNGEVGGAASRTNVEIVEILDSIDDDGDDPRGKKLCVDEDDNANVNGVVVQAANPPDRYIPDFGLDMGKEDFNEFGEPAMGINLEDDVMDECRLFEGLEEYLRNLPAVSEEKANE